jgi:hypothetical protein
MWEVLWLVGGLAACVAVFWGLGRLLRKSQKEDRRYGNPDDWGSAGDHY